MTTADVPQGPTTILGVDCATDCANIGLARASYQEGGCVIEDARAAGRHEDVVKTLATWVEQGKGRALIALDAPLGWPAPLAAALKEHTAGDLIEAEADALFRRQTDDIVWKHTGKRPLDVGADRIARTAIAALRLLDGLRKQLGERVPLAWTPQFEEPVAAIEVYPAATLQFRGLPSSGYKDTSEKASDNRRAILAELGRIAEIPPQISNKCDNANVLDALVCVIADTDFLGGAVLRPLEMENAKREGWIWVRSDRSSSA